MKSLTGKSITFQSSDLHTVADVKEMVCAVEGVPQDQQRLVMAGRGQLDDSHTLGKYNICKDSSFTWPLLCVAEAISRPRWVLRPAA